MSTQYRQKIIHWLTSMLVMHLLVILLALKVWFFDALPHLHLNPRWDYLSWYLSGAAANYIFLFLPIGIWHFADFLQKEARIGKWVHCFNEHRFFLALLFAFAAAVLFVSSEFLNDLGCPEPSNLGPNVFQFDGCGSFTPEWKMAIAATSMLIIVLATIGKITVSVMSRLGRNRALPTLATH